MSKPDNWRLARLHDIASIHSGGTPARDTPDFWGGTIPWLTPGELSADAPVITTHTQDSLTETGLRSSGAVLMPPGSLLVTTRATLGACTIAGVPMATNQGFKNLIFDPNVADPRFYRYLITRMGGKLAQRASGTTFLEISKKEFGNLRVPCPPLAEQLRIVEILDSLLDAEQSIRASITKRRVLRSEVMRHLFRDAEFPSVPLGQVAKVSSGSTPSRSRADYWESGNIPWVRTAEVNFSVITETAERVTQSAVTHTGLKIHPKNTVLLAMYGEGVTRGRSAVLGINASVNQATAAIFCDTNRLDYRYLHYWLELNYEEIRKIGHGSNQTNLSGSLVGALQVPLPTLPEQRKVVEPLQVLDKNISVDAEKLSKLHSLKEAITDDLLSGKVRSSSLA
ncbi:type I restriction endonuclease MjaXP subunit S [Streptomyces hygroscopicus subsp. sporocinereus]|uniref:Type I restriction endonuclease MjaXP subunit S n=1 Tax=Streptomyces hygroscopicus TaxID=1912 RepID=A0ABQ3U7H0_STRHY|nr:restriction endonuclease subunit S [Streptomyces hygroscopicus]GHJ31552.1 type I restriction endonuclease MjaXP subunit S [Streptomyces hygroscopicus]